MTRPRARPRRLPLDRGKIISRRVAQPLVDAGYAVADVIVVLDTLKAALLGESKKAKDEKMSGKRRQTATTPTAKTVQEQLEDLDTNQVIVLGEPEVRSSATPPRLCSASARTIWMRR